MNAQWRSDARRSFFFACLSVLLAAGLPVLAGKASTFMGKDVSGLAAGVVGFYPWIAVGEVLRILGVPLVIAWFAAWTQIGCARAAGVRARQFWILPPVLAYCLVCMAFVLRFPAMLESWLPRWLAVGVPAASRWLSPDWLNWSALATLIVLPAAAWWRQRRHQATWATGLASILVLSAAMWPPWALIPSETGHGETAPNILLIGIDSLRSDRLADSRTMPNLAAFARSERSVSFDEHWVGVPRTFPSWMEILQGRYAAKTGIRHMFPGYHLRHEPMPGLPSALRAAGYATAVCSDFAGDIFPRVDVGYDHVRAPRLDLRTMIRMNAARYFPLLLPVIGAESLRRLFPALAEDPSFSDPGRLTADGIDWIRGEAGKPWFLTLFYSTAHFPYAAPWPYYGRFADPAYDGAYRFQRNPDLAGGKGMPPPGEVSQIRALYDGALAAIDDQIGTLLRWLAATGLDRNTIIVVTADHGEDLMEPGVGQGHGEHLRGVNVLRVPLLIRLPEAMTTPRRVADFVTRSVDVAPTLAGLTGVSLPMADGTDLTGWLRSETAMPPSGQAAYAETGIWFAAHGDGFYQQRRLPYPGISGMLAFDQGYDGEIVLNPAYEKIVTTAKHRMWLKDGFKLIYQPTPDGIIWELYDHARDPANLTDLAATEPSRLAAMQAEFLTYVRDLEGDSARLLSGYVVPP